MAPSCQPGSPHPGNTLRELNLRPIFLGRGINVSGTFSARTLSKKVPDTLSLAPSCGSELAKPVQGLRIQLRSRLPSQRIPRWVGGKESVGGLPLGRVW